VRLRERPKRRKAAEPVNLGDLSYNVESKCATKLAKNGEQQVNGGGPQDVTPSAPMKTARQQRGTCCCRA
jgi:hypothetical protein